MHKVKSLACITVNLVTANITQKASTAYKEWKSQDHAKLEFLREIVWFRGEGVDENDFPKVQSPVLFSILV